MEHKRLKSFEGGIGIVCKLLQLSIFGDCEMIQCHSQLKDHLLHVEKACTEPYVYVYVYVYVYECAYVYVYVHVYVYVYVYVYVCIST